MSFSINKKAAALCTLAVLTLILGSASSRLPLERVWVECHGAAVFSADLAYNSATDSWFCDVPLENYMVKKGTFELRLYGQAGKVRYTFKQSSTKIYTGNKKYFLAKPYYSLA